MKILIFYTPRSKSTAIHNALVARYNLNPMSDMVTKSRIKNQNFDEYPSLFSQINFADNICVKLNGNDFINLADSEISNLYKTIDFDSFDHIIFATRNNLVDAVASYAYMNPSDSSTWHKKKGEVRIGQPYLIPEQKVFYLLRGYVVYSAIKEYICSKVTKDKLHFYEYESADYLIKQDFNVDLNQIDIEPNDYNYSMLATNYVEIKELIALAQDQMKPNTDYFWKNSL